ncbi:MAG: alanine/glycine:cation symporter family protein [Candidatus Hydrogenedentota bacterium]
MTRHLRLFPTFLSLTLILLLAQLSTLPASAQDESTPEAPAVSEELAESAEDEEKDIQEKFNNWFNENINANLAKVLFFPIYTVELTADDGEVMERKLFGLAIYEAEVTDDDREVITSEFPLIVLVLVLGGIFFTLRFGFINVRLFKHSIQVIAGKFDRKDDTGEISHFQALTSALSATVGLGNIAGVAIAISLGGPGAVFWMWVTAFFGMSMKFSSCTLAQLYRRVGEDGRVQGGPMIYLEEGIKEMYPNLAWLGKFFAVMFASFMIMAAFGAGNMFQANQTASIVTMLFFDGKENLYIQLGLGLIMSFLAGIVLIGGIKRIGEITSKIVPGMCIFYCSVCLVIIAMNFASIGSMFASIFSNAFAPSAVFGGFVGVLVQGMRRAAFSNEAGLGSAAIAHAAAKTEEPVREGVVAMIGPFIDTIVICTMTALTILITKSHIDTGGLEGVQITARAFGQLGDAVPIVLCAAVFVFAYSTMISWGYYAERCVEYLFGENAIMLFRFVYVFVIIIAPILSLGAILDFADILLLTLAFPNIIGSALIASKVKPLLDDYVARLKSGEMTPEN